MIKIRAFLVSLALLYSIGATASPVAVNTLSIKDATVSINLGGGFNLSQTTPFTPPVDVVMGTFQKNIMEFGSLTDGFFLEIYSTNSFGAPAPTGTVDAMNKTANFDFSSLRATFTRGTGINTSISDVPLNNLFSNVLKNDYDVNSSGMVDMLWYEDIDLDFLGLNQSARLEIGIKGTVSAVPVPAAVWLFGSGMIALFGFSRKNIAK